MMKMKHALAFGLILSSLAAPCFAGPPYNVDGPQILEKHRSYLLFDYQSSSGGGKENEMVPAMVLKYGVSKDTEFKLEASYATIRKAGKNRVTGLGDIYTGYKWRFMRESKNRPAMTIAYRLKLPAADSYRGLGTGVTDSNIWLTVGKSYKRWGAYANFGYTMLGNAGSCDNGYYGMVLTYRTTEKLVLGAQVYGNAKKTETTRDELAWGVGATYNYAPDKQVYMGIGKSERGFSNLNTFIGWAIYFK